MFSRDSFKVSRFPVFRFLETQKPPKTAGNRKLNVQIADDSSHLIISSHFIHIHSFHSHAFRSHSFVASRSTSSRLVIAVFAFLATSNGSLFLSPPPFLCPIVHFQPLTSRFQRPPHPTRTVLVNVSHFFIPSEAFRCDS